MVEQASDARALGAELSNWGRWGSEDEIGTLNFITDEKRRSAASLVRRGAVFSLQVSMGVTGPATGTRRTNPIHMMVASGTDTQSAASLEDGVGITDDAMFMYLQSGTQWDGLAHVFYDGRLYNGYPASDVDSGGARRLGIEKTCSSYVSRGVLLDVARWRGVECLEGEDRIDGDELEAVASSAGVEIEPGDILLIRTGMMSEYRRTGSWRRYQGSHPGLAPTTTRWLHGRRVAAVASDNVAVEGLDRVRVPMSLPFHMVAIRDMGLSLGEIFDLEDLAADCAEDGVYECFLVAPALNIYGAVGSPVNPMAIK